MYFVCLQRLSRRTTCGILIQVYPVYQVNQKRFKISIIQHYFHSINFLHKSFCVVQKKRIKRHTSSLRFTLFVKTNLNCPLEFTSKPSHRIGIMLHMKVIKNVSILQTENKDISVLGRQSGFAQPRSCFLSLMMHISNYQCFKKFHPKVRNHGEGPYQGLLLVESGYYRFHI